MTNPLSPATDAAGFLPGPLGLRLDEVFLPLTALHAAPEGLDQLVPFGQTLDHGSAFSLRFWPNVAWHSGPCPPGVWRCVDISHGMTRFRLRGVEALYFLAQYTTANLHSAELRHTRAVRCGLNHYDCVIWWANTRDVHIVTDRSLAQSLCDHLRVLALRHTRIETPQSLRPVAPDAPDRRG